MPVVLERWLFAGLLLLGASAALAEVALEGSAGQIRAAIVASGALLYAVITWVAGPRRGLKAELAAAVPAPPHARVEPLVSTCARTLARALVVLVLALLPALVNLLALGVAVAGGIGLVSAFTAARLQAWEDRHGGRLLRVGRGSLLVEDRGP